MGSQPIYVEEVRNENILMTFIRFPWKIYKGDPYWVPPLLKDQLQNFSLNHPFRSHSDMTLFLARQGTEIVGRIAGIIDHNYIKFHQENVGFFGFFESIQNSDVSSALFLKVQEWLHKHRIEKMIGPMNPSTNYECGLLVEGFDAYPCLMMPYNPHYYTLLFEKCGLEKVKDFYAYWLEKPPLYDRLYGIAERLQKRGVKFWIRPINLRRFDEEIHIIKDIYNDAFSKNWGFVPMTDAEIDDLARKLKPLIVPELVFFAYCENEPIGFSVSLPDYNQVLKHLNGKIGLLGALKSLYYLRKIKTIRWILLGVKHPFQKKGAEGLLYIETFRRGMEKGYPQAECSWILEDNLLMQHAIEAAGGKKYKIYRVYGTSSC
jgi:hypothetical protein